MKPFCVACGYPLVMLESRYEHDGNYCTDCNTRAAKVQQNEMTKEEADRELEKRREEYGVNLCIIQPEKL